LPLETTTYRPGEYTFGLLVPKSCTQVRISLGFGDLVPKRYDADALPKSRVFGRDPRLVVRRYPQLVAGGVLEKTLERVPGRDRSVWRRVLTLKSAPLMRFSITYTGFPFAVSRMKPPSQRGRVPVSTESPRVVFISPSTLKDGSDIASAPVFKTRGTL
jgi:hypothetical protein